MATPIYTPTNYGLSEKVAAYICKHFGYEAFPGTTLAPVPCLDLPVHASVSMDQMVSTLVKAYFQSSIDPIWLSKSLGPMESGLDVDREALLLSRHPSSVTGYLDMPAIILGKGDTIALWYLPGGLAWPMQEHVLGTIYPLEHSLKQSISEQSWHTSSSFFKQDDHRLSGCLEFSPARHELGHATWEDDPAISSTLATDASRQWLPDICLPARILSGTLSVMHPPLYDAGLEAMKALRQWSAVADHAMSDALFQWPTVYTNVSVIANCSAPLHHDPHSHVDWYDLLVSLGEYMDCVLDIPTLGL
ncbi:hypothetical protein J3A83DRAFT_4371387 [Scleroderma citrinum]